MISRTVVSAFFLLVTLAGCSNSGLPGGSIGSAAEVALLPDDVAVVEIGAVSSERFESVCAALVGKKRLNTVKVHSSLVSSEGFRHLQRCASLKCLEVVAAGGFDHGCIREILGLSSLRTLELSYVPLEDEWLFEVIYTMDLDELRLGSLAHDDIPERLTVGVFQHIEVPRLRTRRIVLDVSLLNESNNKSAIVSTADMRNVNDKAGRELLVADAIPAVR